MIATIYILLVTSQPIVSGLRGRYIFHSQADCERQAPIVIADNRKVFPRARFTGFRCVAASDDRP